jgi:N-acetylglucosamine kinase-like BadF-type ATPase
MQKCKVKNKRGWMMTRGNGSAGGQHTQGRSAMVGGSAVTMVGDDGSLRP